MPEVRKKLVLSNLDYYKTHLSIINCILPVTMTPMEVSVLAAFMSLEGDITIDRFGSSARKIVMTKLKLSPGGLSNYISSLTEKGFIKKLEKITILPLLLPEKEEQTYTFKLINNHSND